jgi:hypothetical protein
MKVARRSGASRSNARYNSSTSFDNRLEAVRDQQPKSKKVFFKQFYSFSLRKTFLSSILIWTRRFGIPLPNLHPEEVMNRCEKKALRLCLFHIKTNHENHSIELLIYAQISPKNH